MAILRIAVMGDPVLRRVADPVPDPAAPDIAALALHLEDTLRATAANGIAAPQVGASRAMLLYRIAENRLPRGSTLRPLPIRTLVNPVLTPIGDRTIHSVERCLSIPTLEGRVPRHDEVRVEATGLDGRPIVIEAEGYHAILLQHEIDHLNGILYVDRMQDMRTLAFQSEGATDYRTAILGADGE